MLIVAVTASSAAPPAAAPSPRCAVAAYVSATAIDGRAHSQMALSHWLEDWRHQISGFAYGESVQTPPTQFAQGVRAIREMTISAAQARDSTVGDMSAKRSAMESVEAKSRHEMPVGILMDCEPYHGLLRMKFLIRLSVRTGGDTPEITTRIAAREQLTDEIAHEFSVLLAEMFSGTKVTPVVGTFTLGA